MDGNQYDEDEILRIIKKMEKRINDLESQNKDIISKLSQLQKVTEEKLSKREFERKIGNLGGLF